MAAKIITLEELIDRLDGLKGCRVVSFIARIVPEMTGGKSCPFYGRVQKVSKVGGMVNWIYQNSVNNQRIREESEPDFVPLPRRWGERVKGKPFVVHKGNKYVEVKVQTVRNTVYLVDGVPANKKVLKGLRPWLKKNKKPIRQGLEKPVILRDYKIENIRQIDGLPHGEQESVYCVVAPVAASV